MNLSTPTPIQQKAIAPMLAGEDLVATSPTGSGKTCAFSIPMIQAVDTKNPAIQGVVVCPTRELALQITEVMRSLTRHVRGVRVLALYGGEPIYRQIAALRRQPQIIVATPGRLLDHIARKKVCLDEVNLMVMDEADRMLDMGFRPDMDAILAHLPGKRQLALFSATMSKGVRSVAKAYQHHAVTVEIASQSKTVDTVKQYYMELSTAQKTGALVKLMETSDAHVALAFVGRRDRADKIAGALTKQGVRADALHGGMQQRQRDLIMKKLRRGDLDILIATDVAARGLDVDNIDVVINYDIPQDSDSYVHRIGRTGRADRAGTAYTFVTRSEKKALHSIIQATNTSITRDRRIAV